jgi:FkbM family methyltransferase
MLAANCEVNKLENRVECLAVGLGAERAIRSLEVSQFASAQSFSFLGKPKTPRDGRQAALVLPIDQLIDEYGLVCPNYMKIDVPGLTEAIIVGAERTLRRPELREVHVEIIEGTQEGRWLVETLREHGLVIATQSEHRASADVTFVRADIPA